VRQVADEVGLGRVRVLSLEGRDDAAQRWYDGDGGPKSPLAKAAPGHCRDCGFLVRLGGPLATVFGVCATARSPTTDAWCAGPWMRRALRGHPEGLAAAADDAAARLRHRRRDDIENF
jgi:hypothetical protein